MPNRGETVFWQFGHCFLNCLGGFLGDDERTVVVCSNSSSVNSRSGSGWRAKNRFQVRGRSPSDGLPAKGNIEHLPPADCIVQSEKVLIIKGIGCQFCTNIRHRSFWDRFEINRIAHENRTILDVFGCPIDTPSTLCSQVRTPRRRRRRCLSLSRWVLGWSF